MRLFCLMLFQFTVNIVYTFLIILALHESLFEQRITTQDR